MQVTRVGTAFAATDPSGAAGWLDEHLGFKVVVDLGWYASTQHPDHPQFSVDFVRQDHATWVEPAPRTSGAMLALEVPDVDAQHERLVAAGAKVLKPLVTEPWGQRRMQVAGPAGLVVELVQAVAPDPEWLADQGLAG
ncbi:VOC family protein [Nocardioides sp. 616]|uniref:VOC family protein n=1 Tax=Nocardioides sp. 616 TaxID=2268090 RepID=UPI000CE3479C|nr:VOC family protein [Nocardioides sp. 616]